MGARGMQTYEMGAVHRHVAAGEVLTVYYDPEGVKASLEPPAPGAPLSQLVGFASVGLLLIVFGFGGLVGVTRHLLKSRRTGAAGTSGTAS